MSSARLIAAVTLFLIIARGQARPVDAPALQDGPHTNDKVAPVEPEQETPTETLTQVDTEKLASDASKVSVDNEQKLPSEAFAGGDSENTGPSHTSKSFIGSSISQDEIPSNDSDSIRMLDGAPEEKPGDEFKSTVSQNNEDLHSLHKSTVVTSSLPGLDVASSSSEDINTDSAEKPSNHSSSSELQTTGPHTPSTLLVQEHASEEKLNEDPKIQLIPVADVDMHNVTKTVNETSPMATTPATTRASPSDTQSSQFISHDGHISDSKELSITERTNSSQPSNGTETSEELEHNAPHEEETSSRNIEIEAEGTEGKRSNGPSTSSHQSDWLVTAVTVAVAMDGIVKALSSSSPSLKNTTPPTVTLSASSPPDGPLLESSFVDSSISKSTPSPTSSLLPSLPASSAEQPNSSFVDTRSFKDQSMSPSSPTSAHGSAEKSSVDITILKDPPSLPTSTTNSSQLPDPFFADTVISKDPSSSSSTPSSASPLPHELPTSSMVDTRILEDAHLLSSKTVPLFPASPELPNNSSGETPPSRTEPFHALEEVPVPTELPNNSSGKTLLSETEPFHAFEEVPVPKITQTNILKDSTSSFTCPSTRTAKEVGPSSSGDATASSSTLTLSHLSHELPTSLERSPSALPTLSASKISAEVPLSLNSNADSLDNNPPQLTSSFEMLPVATEERRDTADLLKFADMGDDMDVAETMIFLPIYSYRQDSARRRFFRSLADQR